MKRAELEALIESLLEGDISEADFLRVEAELRVNPDARRLYYNQLALTQHLRMEAESLGAGKERKRVSKSLFFLHQVLPKVGIAAALVLVSAISWQVGRNNLADTDLSVAEPVANGYALLAQVSNAQWEGDHFELSKGELLPDGPLCLKSGLAKLELFSGVTVVLEGECRFELKSPMELVVDTGRVRAFVPEAAHGFKVRTSKGEIVDLGTEFALDVTEERAEMVVLDGEIEWWPKADEKRNLLGGEGLGWGQDGQAFQPELDWEAMPLLGDVLELFTQDRELRRENWLSEVTRLREGSQLLAYYPMLEEDGWKRQLVDMGQSQMHGAIVAARRDVDRWGKNGAALNFSPAGSRVRVFVPGEHQSLTFYCWARIDSLDRRFNSLFLTDGHELNEPHWQIMEDGRLFFSVKRRDADKQRDKHIAYSPSFWTPEKSGKWFQIATVYDTEERSTTHYVNGRQLSKDYLSDEYFVDTVKIGAASIGNWSEPSRSDPSFAVRNLNGAIDEFAIFSKALTAAEIAELYDVGKP